MYCFFYLKPIVADDRMRGCGIRLSSESQGERFSPTKILQLVFVASDSVIINVCINGNSAM